MNRILLSILVTLVGIVINCPAQINSGNGTYTFPQNWKYIYGIKPTNANTKDAIKSYNDWKTEFLIPSGTKPQLYGVDYDGRETTVSEGIGYGMLLSAYANDSITFNGLWRFYMKYMNSDGVMNWKIDANGVIDPNGYNGATDADEDAAMALVIASYQWPGQSFNYFNKTKSRIDTMKYSDAAVMLIDSIRKYEVEAGTYILKPGDAFGGSDPGGTQPWNDKVNLSYFAPAYYRIFAQVTGDTTWLNVVEANYNLVAENANATTGFVSDWCLGSTGDTINYGQNFYYDAIRSPWRLTVDYLWFGEKRAQLYCSKMENFIASKGGVAKVVNGYTREGAAVSGSGSGTFKGPLALTGMVNSSFQSYLNSGYSVNVGISTENNSYDYFGHSLQSLAIFVMTGNFYPLPICTTSKPQLGPDLSLCVQQSYTLNSNISYSSSRHLQWNTGDTTNILTVNQKGTYVLTVDSADCQNSDTIYIAGIKANLGNDITNLSPGNSVMLNSGTGTNGMQLYWRYASLTATPFDSTDGTVTVSLPGKYYVTADSGGCTNTDSVLIEGTDFLLYPNPNSGIFTIEPLDTAAKTVTISIYSVSNGILKTVLSEQQYTASSFPQKYTFNLSTIGTGMYLARVATNGKIYTKKFIIIN